MIWKTLILILRLSRQDGSASKFSGQMPGVGKPIALTKG